MTNPEDRLDKQFLAANEKCKRMKNGGNCVTCKLFVVWGAGVTDDDGGRQHFACRGLVKPVFLKQQANAEARYARLTSVQ